MKKILLATISAVVISGIGCASLAEGPEKGRPKGGMLAQMDGNSDGVVSKDEFIAFSTKRFTEMDANNDGKVTKEEMQKHHEAEKTKHEQRQKEMEAEEDKRFKEMDADGDGKISKEEMKKHKEAMKDKPGKD